MEFASRIELQVSDLSRIVQMIKAYSGGTPSLAADPRARDLLDNVSSTIQRLNSFFDLPDYEVGSNVSNQDVMNAANNLVEYLTTTTDEFGPMMLKVLSLAAFEGGDLVGKLKQWKNSVNPLGATANEVLSTFNPMGLLAFKDRNASAWTRMNIRDELYRKVMSGLGMIRMLRRNNFSAVVPDHVPLPDDPYLQVSGKFNFRQRDVTQAGGSDIWNAGALTANFTDIAIPLDDTEIVDTDGPALGAGDAFGGGQALRDNAVYGWFGDGDFSPQTAPNLFIEPWMPGVPFDKFPRLAYNVAWDVTFTVFASRGTMAAPVPIPSGFSITIDVYDLAVSARNITNTFVIDKSSVAGEIIETISFLARKPGFRVSAINGAGGVVVSFKLLANIRGAALILSTELISLENVAPDDDGDGPFESGSSFADFFNHSREHMDSVGIYSKKNFIEGVLWRSDTKAWEGVADLVAQTSKNLGTYVTGGVARNYFDNDFLTIVAGLMGGATIDQARSLFYRPWYPLYKPVQLGGGGAMNIKQYYQAVSQIYYYVGIFSMFLLLPGNIATEAIDYAVGQIQGDA